MSALSLEKILQKSIQFFRYVVTGGLTTFLDIFILWIGVEFLHLAVVPWATALAFSGALLFSFVVNSSWTFASRNTNSRVWESKKFLKFFFVSATAFGLTMALMWFLTHQVEIFYLYAKIVTSLVILAWNFLGNSLWTFSGQEEIKREITIVEAEKKFFPYEVSLVIPAYNEENRITKTLQDAEKFFETEKISHEIIVVSDGSTDKTVEVSEKNFSELGIQNAKTLDMTQNKGKGSAIARGVDEAQGRYILFCDADGATPFSEYLALKKMMKTYHIAIGSRYLDRQKEKGHQPLHRIFFSRIINFLAQVFLVDGYEDTQCGFKLFRSESGKKIFAQQKIFRYAFDIEFLVLAKKLQYDVAEVPIEWHDQEGSKFSGLQDGIKTAYDFIRIKFFTVFGMYEVG